MNHDHHCTLRLRGPLGTLAAVFCIAAASAAEAAPDAGAPSAMVDRYLIAEFRVEGNTVLDERDIERAVYPFLGPEGDVERIGLAAKALQGVYKDRGYPTVGVTPSADVAKQLRNGTVTLEVFEQRVDRLRVTGGRYFSNRQVEQAVPSVQPGKVLSAPDMQRELDTLARRTPDRSVRPLLRSGDAPGKLDVELQVDDKLPLHANIELNNLHSANTEELRVVASASYNNLFQRQDGVAFMYQTSPEDTNNVQVYSGTYIHRPTWTNTIFALTGVKTDSDVATSVGGTTVLGKGKFLITRGIKPLRVEGSVRDSLVFGLDYKDSEDVTGFEREIIEGVPVQETTAKSIKYFNFTTGYDATHDLWGGSNRYSVAGNWGVRGFNDHQEFETKRFKGEPNYFFVKTSLQRTQPLPWAGFSLHARIASQLTTDVLIGNEEMSLGGYSTVRGYLEAEELADKGYNASLELDWRHSTWPVTTYLFWDWGLGQINEPLPEEDDTFSLSSAGVGARLESWYGINAEVLWALALRHATETNEGDSRVTFLLSYGL